MKPSFRSLFKAALPALIVVPSLMQQVRAGGSNVIFPDNAGNVVVAGDHDEINGTDWTVVANGGPTSPFTVTIEKGAILKGDPSFGNSVEVSSSGYTVHNYGTLDAIENGIVTSAVDTVIHNHAGGLILGGSNGITFNRMINDSFSTLDVVQESGTVMNDGEIIGTYHGIYGGNHLTVENSGTGRITGSRGDGIFAGTNLNLTNDGTITGMVDGLMQAKTLEPVLIFKGGNAAVFADANATITNHGTINAAFGHGVFTFSDLNLTNTGTIEGNGVSVPFETINTVDGGSAFGSGVYTGDNAVIDNKVGATIYGSYNGITSGRFLTLTNAGAITGSSEEGGNAGVQTYDGSTITNSGEITGDIDGIVIRGSEIIEVGRFIPEVEVDLSTTITNSGWIRGGSGTGIVGSDEIQTVNNKNGIITGSIAAIDLAGGDDVINLGFGSVINGDIAGGEGFDVLNFTGGASSINEQSNIVHGNVGGIETINKTGAGFAFIGGSGESFNVFTDQINVSEGGLVINGNLASLSEGKTRVVLTGNGQLDGTGTWNADLTINAGGISAGGTNNQLDGPHGILVPLSSPTVPGLFGDNSVGILTINGNVNVPSDILVSPAKSAVAPPESTYIRVDINPQTPIKNGVNSDLIVQNGPGNTFDVTGMDIRISPTNVNKTLTEGTYTIIDSDSPLKGVDALGKVGVQFNGSSPDTGKFVASESGENNRNTVLTNYFTEVDTTDPAEEILTKASGNPLDSNLVIKIKHGYQNLPGLSENQAAFGAALDASVNSGNPLIQDFIAALDYSDLAAVQATLATLDPSNTMGLVDTVVNGNYRLHRLVQEHLAGIRGGGREVSSTGASSKDAKGAIIPGETTTRLAGRANAWGSVSYDGQDYNAAGSRPDFDGDSGAFTAGFDWLVAPQLVVGLVLDGSKGNYDGKGYSSDVDSFRGAVYGTWGAGMGLYSDFLLGYGNHGIDTDRSAAGILGGTTSSDTDADSLQAMWTVGYTMGDQTLKHGPFAGLEYQNVSVDGYNQGGPLPLAVGGYDVDSLRGLIGYRANASYGSLRPYASVAYAHEFQDGANSTTATFGGTPFRVSGGEQSSAFLISLGTGVTLTSSLTLDVGYRGDIAVDDGITSHGGSIGLNYAF